jgi:MFS transporter, Spinster family, sphingosine-1-phosphate transporter
MMIENEQIDENLQLIEPKSSTVIEYESIVETAQSIEKPKNNRQNLLRVLMIGQLCALNLLNYTDRYLISAVLIDLRAYFQVSISSGGLLHTSFLLSFTFLAPLVGYLGDRVDRKILLVCSCALWILSIVGGSFVASNQFGLFLFSRVLFGAASSLYECIALPIISDLFADINDTQDVNYSNRKKLFNRTRALFLFYLGPPLGTGLAFILANSVRELIPDDWRYVMRITPVLITIIMLSILFGFKEPRHAYRSHSVKSFRADVFELIKNTTYILQAFANACAILALVGFNWWSPSYIIYMLMLKPDSEIDMFEIKTIYSVLQTTAGFFGNLIATEISNYLRNKFSKNSAIFDCFLHSISLLMCSILLFMFLWLSNSTRIFDFIFYTLFTLFLNCWRILLANILLDIVRPRSRASANGLLLFFMHLSGDSTAPLWLGEINDSCLVSRQSNDKPSYFDYFYCTQISLYPLVFLLFIGGSFSLFSTLSFHRDKIES